MKSEEGTVLDQVREVAIAPSWFLSRRVARTLSARGAFVIAALTSRVIGRADERE